MARKAGGGRGRKARARVAAPLLAPVRLVSHDGRRPIHFRHDGKPRGAGDAARYQAYVDRSKVRDPLAGHQSYIDRAEVAEEAGYGALVSAGNIGSDLDARRGFWGEVEAIEAGEKKPRSQNRIIAEFPHEVTARGRLAILADFGRQFEDLGMPWHGAGHRPDAYNDPRNYHCHVVYYGRAGRRDPETGAWSFAVAGAVETGRFPWGTTEEPAKREKRMRRQAERAADAEARARFEATAEEARRHSEAASRRAVGARSGLARRAGRTFPWGSERPEPRAKRLERQLAQAGTPRLRARYESDLEAVRAWRETPGGAGPAGPADMGWVAHLRGAWCGACNRVLAEEGHLKRYSPLSYEALGIEAEAAEKLGTEASQLAARGVATAAAKRNDRRARARLAEAGAGAQEVRDAQLDMGAEMLRRVSALDPEAVPAVEELVADFAAQVRDQERTERREAAEKAAAEATVNAGPAEAATPAPVLPAVEAPAPAEGPSIMPPPLRLPVGRSIVIARPPEVPAKPAPVSTPRAPAAPAPAKPAPSPQPAPIVVLAAAPQIGRALDDVVIRSADVRGAAAELAKIHPETRKHMNDLNDRSQNRVTWDVRSAREDALTAEWHKALTAAPNGRPAVKKLRHKLEQLAAAADALAIASARHGGMTPNQAERLNSTRPKVLRETDWIPLVPGWQDAPQSDFTSGYIGLNLSMVLDNRRFTKRSSDGGTYRIASLPASILAAAEAERMRRQSATVVQRVEPARVRRQAPARAGISAARRQAAQKR